jgi:hypothetical protein
LPSLIHLFQLKQDKTTKGTVSADFTIWSFPLLAINLAACYDSSVRRIAKCWSPNSFTPCSQFRQQTCAKMSGCLKTLEITRKHTCLYKLAFLAPSDGSHPFSRFCVRFSVNIIVPSCAEI